MAWFSKIGVMFRRHSRLFATTGVLTAISACFYSQTFGLQHYKRLMAHYKDGVLLPVDDETQQLIEAVFYIFVGFNDTCTLNQGCPAIAML